MALRIVASVCWCALFVNSIFCCDSRSSFTSDEFMNIRETTPGNLFLTFLTSSVELLDLLVKGALTFVHAVKCRRRGKHTGALMHLRRCRLRTPLPGIFLSDVRSLCSKLNELQLLVGKNRDFSISSVLCFTETWLCGLISDSVLQLAGFQLFSEWQEAAVHLQLTLTLYSPPSLHVTLTHTPDSMRYINAHLLDSILAHQNILNSHSFINLYSYFIAFHIV